MAQKRKLGKKIDARGHRSPATVHALQARFPSGLLKGLWSIYHTDIDIMTIEGIWPQFYGPLSLMRLSLEIIPSVCSFRASE